MRKILSAALASAMVLSMASMTAFATTYDEAYQSETLTSTIFTSDSKAKDANNNPVFKKLTLHNGKSDSVGANGDVVYVNDDVYIPLNTINVSDATNGTADGITAGRDFADIMTQHRGDIDSWSLKVKKNEGSKIVDKVTLVQKSDGASRVPMIKITFKPDFTDTEFKVDLDITLTNKTKAKPSINDGDTDDLSSEGGKLFFNTRFYVSNRTDEGTDHDYMAGRAGVVVKPTKNEDNEVIWENENRDIAKLTFYADSSTAKYFPKLNTKWDNQAYFEYFNDQDSFLFEFISNPQISSTSRAVLELYNPYINDDDETTVEPENVIIYQIVDGLPVDVTAQFTYGENDNGDMTFSTKTRVLGSYIFCEKPYEEFVGEVAPDVTPDATAPVDTTKKPANTGRYN